MALGLGNSFVKTKKKIKKLRRIIFLDEIWSTNNDKWNTSNNLWSENVFSTLNRNWNSVDDIWNEI